MKFNISILLLILVANQAFAVNPLPELRALYPLSSLSASEGKLPQPDLTFYPSTATPTYDANHEGTADSAITLSQGNYLEWNVQEYLYTSGHSINFWVKKGATQVENSDYTLVSIKAKQGSKDMHFELKESAIVNKLNYDERQERDNLLWDNEWNLVTISLERDFWGNNRFRTTINGILHSVYSQYSNEYRPSFTIQSIRLGYNGETPESQFLGSFANLRIFNGKISTEQALEMQAPGFNSDLQKIARYNLDDNLQDKLKQYPRLSFKSSESLSEVSQGKRVMNRENQYQSAIRLEQGDNLYIPRGAVTTHDQVSIGFWFRTNLVNPMYLLRFVNDQNQEVFNMQNFEAITNGFMMDIGQISNGENVWKYISVAFDLVENTVKVYLNGVQRNSYTTIYNNANGEFLKNLKYIQLGQVTTADGYIDIDDVNIHSRAFDQMAAWIDFHSQKTESYNDYNQDLRANWRLDSNLNDQTDQNTNLRYMFNYNTSFVNFQEQTFNGRQQKVKAFQKSTTYAISTIFEHLNSNSNFIGISFWIKANNATKLNDHFLRLRTIWNPTVDSEHTFRLDFYYDRVFHHNTNVNKSEAVNYNLTTNTFVQGDWNHVFVKLNKYSDLDLLINGVSILDENNGISLNDFFESDPSIDIGERFDGYAHNLRLHQQDRTYHDEWLLQLIDFDKNYSDEYSLLESENAEPNFRNRKEANYKLTQELKDSVQGGDTIIYNTPVANKTLPQVWNSGFVLEELEYYTVPQKALQELERDFTISLIAQQYSVQSNESEYNLVSLEFWDSYENQNINEIKVTNQALIVNGQTHTLPQSIVSDLVAQNVAITYSYSTLQLEIYVQGQNQFSLNVGQLNAVKDIHFGKKYYVSVYDISLFNFVLSQDEIRKNEQDNDDSFNTQDIITNLHSYYTLQEGELRDVRNNGTKLEYSHQVVDTPIKQVFDRNSLANGAVKILNSQLKAVQDLELIVNNQTQDISVTFRAKWNSAVSAGFFSANFLEGGDVTVFTQQLGDNFSSRVLPNQWQTYTATFKAGSVNVEIVVYIDGYEVQRIDKVLSNLDTYYKLVSFNFGDIQVGYDVEIDDIIVHRQALSKWEQLQITDLTTDIEATLPAPPPTCEERLANLSSDALDISFNIIYYNNEFYQKYSFDFGPFQNDLTCFLTEFKNGEKQLGYSYRNLEKSIIDLQFPRSQALTKGCVQTTPTELDCEFVLTIKHNNVTQLTKTFKSKTRTPDLTNIKNGLQLQISTDSQTVIDQFDKNVATEINFCADATCTTTVNDLVLVKDQISYVQLKVTSEGYNQYYPVHQSIKLGTTEIVPENLADIQNWNQKGQIIYAIKPTISSSAQLLSIHIELSYTAPASAGNRLLQEQSMSLGKNAFVQVVDGQEQQQQLGNDFYLRLSYGVMLFISFITFTVVFGYVRVQSIKKHQQLQISNLNRV